jgi:hypothetical protein
VALLIGVAFLPIAVIQINDPPRIPLLQAAADPSPDPSRGPGASVDPAASDAAAGSGATAPGPSATPSPTWPPPPAIVGSEALTVELYKAQLAAHREDLAAGAESTASTGAPDDSRVEEFAWSLAVVGLFAVGAFALVPFGWRWLRKRYPSAPDRPPNRATTAR